MNRRECLKYFLSLPLMAAAPPFAFALGKKSKLRLAQVLYDGGNPNPRPNGLRRLAWEVEKRTSIDVELEPAMFKISDSMLFQYPFLYLGGDSGFAPFAKADVDRLRRFLTFGGFLLIDSSDARLGGAFDKSVRELIAAIYPKHPLIKIDKESTVYKSFYLIENPVGRVVSAPYLEGIESDGRIVLLYCQNDLSGAWARDNFGQWEYGVYPGGDRQREMAIRLGINIIMYAMCLDYKADQVHIPFILKRRRWHVDPGP